MIFLFFTFSFDDLGTIGCTFIELKLKIVQSIDISSRISGQVSQRVHPHFVIWWLNFSFRWVSYDTTHIANNFRCYRCVWIICRLEEIAKVGLCAQAQRLHIFQYISMVTIGIVARENVNTRTHTMLFCAKFELYKLFPWIGQLTSCRYTANCSQYVLFVGKPRIYNDDNLSLRLVQDCFIQKLHRLCQRCSQEYWSPTTNCTNDRWDSSALVDLD